MTRASWPLGSASSWWSWSKKGRRARGFSMPMRALARERMMRSVMAARLPRTEVRVAGRRTAAVAGLVMVCVVAGVEWDGVDLVAADFVDAVLEERFGLRPFALVLKGL